LGLGEKTLQENGKKLHNQDMHVLYSLLDIGVVKSGLLRRLIRVARIGPDKIQNFRWKILRMTRKRCRPG
jgi:hypothetical protein